MSRTSRTWVGGLLVVAAFAALVVASRQSIESDSVWFWVVLVGVVGLAALGIVIDPSED